MKNFKRLFILMFGLAMFSSAFADGGVNATTNSSAIASGIGAITNSVIGSNDTFGMIIIGVLILIFGIISVFAARIGLIGATVTIVPLTLVLSQYGYLPDYLQYLLYIVLGFIWALIILRVTGVR